MVTTFERLAKVMKGYVKPANWIERAFASIGSAVLPSVSASDNGKILGVSSGNWNVVDAPSGLPTVTSADEGKVLTVNSSGEWDAETASGELPTVTSSDEGKVLTVNSSGEWDAETPSGGSNVLIVTESESSGSYVLDKTGNEIKNADIVKLVTVDSQTDEYFYYLISYRFDSRDGWYFNFLGYSSDSGAFQNSYNAPTLNDYPSYTP